MMSKFKQLRLRLVVAVAVLLMAGMGTEAFAQSTLRIFNRQSRFTSKDAMPRQRSVLPQPKHAPTSPRPTIWTRV